MKIKQIILLTVFSVCAVVSAVEYNAPIKSVTVYDSSAMVKRGIMVNIPAGKSVLTLEGLPRAADSNSIAAMIGSPDVTITSVALRYKVQPPPVDSDVAKCRQAVMKATDARDHNRDHIQQIEAEIQRLKNLTPTAPQRKADGKPKEYDPAAADAFLRYIADALATQYKTLRDLEKKAEKLEKELTIANETFQKLFSRNQIAKITAEISVDAKKAVRAPLEVTYLIPNASWYPAYELRIDPENDQVQLASYALLKQSTGENWQNIPLFFSSAIPSVSADLPQLAKRKITERFESPVPQPLPVYQPRLRKSQEARRNYKANLRSMKEKAQAPTVEKQYIRQQGIWANTIQFNDGRQITIHEPLQQISDDTITYRTADGTTTSLDLKKVRQISAVSVASQGLDYPTRSLKNPATASAGLDFKFASATPVNAPSNGQYQKIPLTTKTLKGMVYYHFVPGKSKHAYRKCNVYPKEALPLLAGPANIFYGSELVGNTDLPTILPTESRFFTVNVGVDQRIKVKRTVQKKAENTGMFTDLRKTAFEIETTFRNTTGKSMKYEFLEQVPATSTDKIKITGISLDNAPLKNTGTFGRGLIKHLFPGATARHVVKFTIEYPADHIITHRIGYRRPMPGFGVEDENANVQK